jgi:predicted nucleic acid-binding protein
MSEKAVLLRSRVRAVGEQLIAPTLLIPEVTSTLRLAVYSSRIDPGFGAEAFSAFRLFPINLHEVQGLADAAWTWAVELNAPRLYDMYYLALAEREQCDLWTADRRFVRTVGTRSSRTRWVGTLEDES